MKTVFVGQGPNQTSWHHGLEVGRRFAALRLSIPIDDPKVDLPAIDWAERYCARVALTGSVGKRIAPLIDMTVSDFFRGYERRNLNARWGGKKGKGDTFDTEEGRRTAEQLIAEPSFSRYVLLGKDVAECFDVRGDPLSVRLFPHERPGKSFLLFPHPSGINLWWNEEFNRFRARKRLREYLGIDQ